MSAVALLAEGVDRNHGACATAGNVEGVALLAEGVDRNLNGAVCHINKAASPSSRRAWIEMISGRMMQ